MQHTPPHYLNLATTILDMCIRLSMTGLSESSSFFGPAECPSIASSQGWRRRQTRFRAMAPTPIGQYPPTIGHLREAGELAGFG